METLAALTEDQRDALQELMNIAMGQAAERLARLTNTMVTLSVPFIYPLIREQDNLLIPDHLRRSSMIVTRQSFLGSCAERCSFALVPWGPTSSPNCSAIATAALRSRKN